MEDQEEERTGLCTRCEHRVKWFETRGKYRPRMECGTVHINENGEPSFHSSHSCYMFKPVMPVVTSKSDPRDPRPRFGPAIFSAREGFVRVAKRDKDVVLNVKVLNKRKGTIFLHWVSKDILKKEINE